TQTQRAPIQVILAQRAQRFVDELLKSVDRLRLSAEMIVKAHHLRNEPRAKTKRGLRGLCRDASGRTGDDVALERGEPPRRIREPRVEAVVQLLARDSGWHASHNQLPRSAPRRNHEERRLVLSRASRDRLAESVQIRHANESRPAWSDG